MIRIGLRVDVDTFRGTKQGVPRLCAILARHNVHASFFFSVGPDNMGRHIWRLLRPTFLWKMLRTNAASLYGWDILWKGFLWPGPMIGNKLAYVIRDVESQGHEVGLHAWDHQKWQAQMAKMSYEAMVEDIQKGVSCLTGILGHPPVCSAVAGWQANDQLLRAKEQFGFLYNSDCRGQDVFYPLVQDDVLVTPQVPVTLPTYDEVIGRDGISDANYNDFLIGKLSQERWNVLTIHAEAEGMRCADLFEDFVARVQAMGGQLAPLSQCLNEQPYSVSSMSLAGLAGREGCVATQIEPSF